MSELRLASETALPLERSAAAAKPRTLFLLTPSGEPCGVEVFTQRMVAALAAADPAAGCGVLPVSRRVRDVVPALRRIARADQIVWNFPLVAWKRLLIVPWALLLASVLLRRRSVVFLHEWNAMHWLRRATLIPFVALSHTIVVLSPYIRDQIARDRWIGRYAKKCRLVPHPPTIRRPEKLMVTETVRRVERAAAGFDIVIGYFGAIYGGKAPSALLDICDHLRSRGIRALVVFIGSFTKSIDGYEAMFRARIEELSLQEQVIITGYVESDQELFTLFERIGAFLFLFPEGLTARRSSVIACLQSGRPVVVSAARSPDEFSHHAGLRQMIEGGALSFVPRSAGIPEIADQLLAAASRRDHQAPALDAESWWQATIAAVRGAFRP